MLEEKEFQQRIQKIEGLVHKIEALSDENARASAIELMQSLMELHGAGLERMMEIIWQTGESNGQIIDRIIEGFGRDGLVGSLLILYGLHPLGLEARVMQALDKVRPYLRSHGGNVELLGVTEGAARLRLEGSCNGCASSAQTLKLAIEEAIYEAAPDVTSLEVEGVVEQQPRSGFVPVEQLRGKDGASRHASKNGKWQEVSNLDSLAQRSVRSVEVGGRSVLFCRLGETFYAYSIDCPECGGTLEAARVEENALVCPTCGQRYDVVRAGQGLDKSGLHLEPIPLLIEQGRARVALPN